MCRLFIIRHSKCGHLYYYEPINQCEAGFSHELNKCLAQSTTSPDFGNTIPLFDHPFCKDCIRLGSRRIYLAEMIQEIRQYYAREEIAITRDAEQLGLSYKDMNLEVLELRARRKEETKTLKVNARLEDAYVCTSGDIVGISALGKRMASFRLNK